MKWFIGYGYRYFLSLIWVLLFTFIGAFVLGTTGEAENYGFGERLFVSFDLLLPIIEFTKKYADVSLQGWQQYYFYFHKLMGYVLASFVIAGLSGITKK